MSRVRAGAYALSLVAGVALAGLLWLTSSALPVVTGAPTTDPYFGAANACLADALEGPRLGFAVSPDGVRVAAVDARGLVVCERAGGPPRRIDVAGPRSPAFDGAHGLWFLTDAPTSRVMRWSAASGSKSVGELRAHALTGLKDGVVVLEAGGRLLSLDLEGVPRAARDLSPPPHRFHQLVASPEGRHVALIADDGVMVLDARTLTTVRSESPCLVQRALWRLEPDTLLLVCGPGASWGLHLQVATGAREATALPSALPLATLPAAALYVRGCDDLPCTVNAD